MTCKGQYVKVGGWGGSGGTNPWSFTVPDDCQLSKIRLASDATCIHSIQFTYITPKGEQINSPIYGTDHACDKIDITCKGQYVKVGGWGGSGGTNPW
nr:protein GOS9-like [Tanacetum cinerariifolium]